MKPLLLAAAAALAVAGCSRTEPPATASEEAAPSASQALAALFAESDAGSLSRNPLEGLSRGLPGYGQHLPEYFSNAYYAASRSAA